MTSTISLGTRNAGLDGYVHKFRFEAEPVFTTAADIAVTDIEVEDGLVENATRPGGFSSELRLLVGFFISVIVLSGLLLAVVWTLRS